jgi:SAM-dependent methyltransferase
MKSSQRRHDRFQSVVDRLIPEVEYHQNRYARALAESLVSGVRWLDLGAGRRLHGGWIGASQQELACRARLLVGCDVSTQHMRANRHLSAAVAADVALLPFADGSFELVSANMVLEHLMAPRITFREVARILAPNGIFAFVTPNRHHPAVFGASVLLPQSSRRLLAQWIEHREPEHIFPTAYRCNTVGRIRDYAADAGLRPVVLETFPSYPFVRTPSTLVALECLVIRAMMHQPLRRLASNIIGILQKPSAAHAMAQAASALRRRGLDRP